MSKSVLAGLLLALATSKRSSYGGSYYLDLVRDFPDADLESLYRSSGNFRDAKRATFGAIGNAESSILTATRSIDSLFLRLPSSN